MQLLPFWINRSEFLFGHFSDIMFGFPPDIWNWKSLKSIAQQVRSSYSKHQKDSLSERQVSIRGTESLNDDDDCDDIDNDGEFEDYGDNDNDNDEGDDGVYGDDDEADDESGRDT